MLALSLNTLIGPECAELSWLYRFFLKYNEMSSTCSTEVSRGNPFTHIPDVGEMHWHVRFHGDLRGEIHIC